MVVSPRSWVLFVSWRLVALALLGFDVSAFLPEVISPTTAIGSDPEAGVSYHGSRTFPFVASRYSCRVKTELSSLFGSKRRYRRSWEDSGDSRYDMSLSMGLGFNKIIGGRHGSNSGRDRSESEDDEDDFDSVTRNSPMTVSQAMKHTDKGSTSKPAPRFAPQASQRSSRTGMDTLRSVASRIPEPRDPEPSSPKAMRMGEDPATRRIDVHVLDKTESVQERINRVKAGKMTPEEKAAFLESALTAGSTVEARKPVIRSREAEKPASASPFPADSAFRSFARGNKAPVPNEDTLENSQQKKREYLNMITNPNRFGSYKSYSQHSSRSDTRTPSPVKGGASGTSRLAKNDGYSAQIAPPSSTTDHPSHTSGSKSRYDSERASTLTSLTSSTSPQDPVQSPMPNDLGARLGMAAMASESQRQKELLKAEETRREQERQREKERQAFERQAMEIARQKQEEMTIREAEARARRRQQEEEAARRKEEEKREAEERMAALMKAQEEYWQKKLASERASKAKLWGEKQKLEEEEKEKERETKEAIAEEEKVEESTSEKPEVESKAEEVEFVAPVPSMAPIPTPSSSSFNPNEQYLVEEGAHDREEDWYHNQEAIAREASKYSGGKPLNDIQSESQFIADQARKKSLIDHQKDEQLEKLRALNSPLPSPVKPPRAMPPAPPFQEHRSVLGYPSNFQPQRQLGTPFEPQKPSGIAPKKSDQLDSLFNSMNGGDSYETSPKPAVDAVDRKATISELQGKQDDTHSNDDKGGMPGWGNLFGSAVKKQPTRELPKAHRSSGSASPARKGPIRMSIPAQDDDDARSMDVGAAIRQAKAAGTSVDQDSRSKKWGVDMSRFTDE